MTRTRAQWLHYLLHTGDIMIISSPGLLLLNVLAWWADSIMHAKPSALNFIIMFVLGAIMIFTVGVKLGNLFTRRTEGVRKRVRDALRESKD